MKKHRQSRVSRLFWRILKLGTWFDWDRMKSISLSLWQGFKRLFVPHQTVEVEESFNQASQKFELSEESLLSKQNALFRLSLIMLIIAAFILSYAGYQLCYGSIKAFVVSFIVTLIALVLAFRYHFWYFQIKQRKLGCTFNEWFRQGLLGEKK